jgi:hypothetical protein
VNKGKVSRGYNAATGENGDHVADRDRFGSCTRPMTQTDALGQAV